MGRITHPVVRALLLVLATGARASAQLLLDEPPSDGANESRSDREPRHSMTLTLSLSGAGATDTTTSGAIANAGAPSAYHSDSDALLTYSTRGRRASLSVTAQSVFRYDPGDGGLSARGNQGTFDLSVAGSQTRLHATQS